MNTKSWRIRLSATLLLGLGLSQIPCHAETAYRDPSINSAYRDPSINSAYRDPYINSAYRDPYINSAYRDPYVNSAYRAPWSGPSVNYIEWFKNALAPLKKSEINCPDGMAHHPSYPNDINACVSLTIIDQIDTWKFGGNHFARSGRDKKCHFYSHGSVDRGIADDSECSSQKTAWTENDRGKLECSYLSKEGVKIGLTDSAKCGARYLKDLADVQAGLARSSAQLAKLTNDVEALRPVVESYAALKAIPASAPISTWGAPSNTATETR